MSEVQTLTVIEGDATALTVQQATRALTPVQYASIINERPDYIPGSELIEPDDLPFAQLKLVQAQTPDVKAEPGTWLHSITSQAYAQFSGVLLSFAKGRVMFADYGTEQESVLCASNDALFPRQEFLAHVVDNIVIGLDAANEPLPCAHCPFAQFGQNGEAPRCSKVYSFALLDAEYKMPVVASLKKTGIKAARALAYLTKYPTMGRGRFIVLASEKVTDEKKRTYFVPTVTIGEETTPELRAIAREISMSAGNLAARLDVVRDANGDGLIRAGVEMGGVPEEPPDIPW